MKALIRYLRQGPDGVIEAQDSDATVNELTIGSAADRQIQLLGREVGAEHAAIRGSGAKLEISCRGKFRVQVNGKSVASAGLAVGDQINIAGHQLRLVRPPAGFDIAIEVQLTSTDASEFENAFRTDLDKTWLSKRSGAWLLAILTLAVAFAVPLASIYSHRQGKPTALASIDDTLWSAGPLSAAHEHAAGKKCSACHQQLFVHVQDTACRNCHRSVADHIAAADLALTHLGKPGRCAQCHREHDGGASQMAVRDDNLCVGCHADPHALFGSLKKVSAASGFSRGAHPAFSIQLLKPPAGIEMAAMRDWVQSREPVAGAREQSNLKFSHQQHLDGTRVTRASDGGALGCADCHMLQNDGEHFVPVTMERSCASCHQLTFDANAPTRQLPHGKPLDAMYVIEDYFARKYSDPTLPVKKSTQARRLPDKEIPTDVPVDVCTGPSYICANRRAAAEIENQFAGRGCVSCHVVADSQAKDIHERFQVTPVHLSQDYFATARFNHRAHAVQKDLTGDAACLSCHKARGAKDSSQVLIPDIDNCLQCHSDRYVKDQVTVQCVSCHSYHPVAIMQASRREE
jgi:predicted CXXCH cytochrome family protein